MSVQAIPYHKYWGSNWGSAVINVSSSSPVKLVEGVSGRSIWVLSYVFVADAANSVAFEDEDGTVLGGPMPIAANGGVAVPFNESGHFHVGLGKDLMMDNSTADQVGGHLTYVIV